jgi:hypothetical protein
MSALGGSQIFIGMFLLFLIMFLGASAGDIENCSECDDRFVNLAGDNMTGNLNTTGDVTAMYFYGSGQYLSGIQGTVPDSSQQYSILVGGDEGSWTENTHLKINDENIYSARNVTINSTGDYVVFYPRDGGTSRIPIQFTFTRFFSSWAIPTLEWGGWNHVRSNNEQGMLIIFESANQSNGDQIGLTIDNVGAGGGGNLPTPGGGFGTGTSGVGDMYFIAARRMFLVGNNDADDTVEITTTSDVPRISTNGTCDLELGSSTNIVRPFNNKTTDFGTMAYAWKDIYADNFINVASETDSVYIQPDEALAAIVGIRADVGERSMTEGYDKPDYNSYPDAMAQEFKIKIYNKTVTNTVREPLIHDNGTVSYVNKEVISTEVVREVVPDDYVGGKDEIVETHNVRSLLINIDYLNSAIQALEARVSALEGG